MTALRLLVCHPGASYSVADIYDGYAGALVRAGHQVTPYALDVRIERARDWLAYNWRKAKKHHPDIERPTPADIIYQASQGIIERALRLAVDGVLIISGMYLYPDVLVLLRRAGIPTALMLTESPYDDEQQVRIVPYVDVVFTNERSSVGYLRQHNPETHYLPHAYDPQKHYPSPEAEVVNDSLGGRLFPGKDHSTQAGSDVALSGVVGQPRLATGKATRAQTAYTDGDAPSSVAAHDVVFVGSYFRERLDLLGGVDWSGIDLGLYGAVEGIPSRHRLRQYVRGGIVPNDQAAALYRRAKIGLNLYRTSKGWGRNAPQIDHAESLNPRAVELAACGVFHLSDPRAEVTEIFGKLVPTFTDSAGLGAQIRYYLDHPAERRLKAAHLLGAIAHRTYDAGAAQLVMTLQTVWGAHIHDTIPA